MGMFDYITHEGSRYQTKDTPDQYLSEYRIENGRLVFDEYHVEDVPKEQRPYPDDDGLLGWIGSQRRIIDQSSVDQHWHGYIDMVPDDGSGGSFRAKFTDGNLVSFELLADPESDMAHPEKVAVTPIEAVYCRCGHLEDGDKHACAVTHARLQAKIDRLKALLIAACERYGGVCSYGNGNEADTDPCTPENCSTARATRSQKPRGTSAGVSGE
jgi:hypothetical protein